MYDIITDVYVYAVQTGSGSNTGLMGILWVLYLAYTRMLWEGSRYGSMYSREKNNIATLLVIHWKIKKCYNKQ